MPFVRHEGRKDWGLTRAGQTVSCYKCKKEIEMREVFYSKTSNSNYRCKTVGYICDTCYQNLYIDI